MGLVDTKKTVIEKPLLWIGAAIVALSLITLGVVVFLRMNSSVDEGVLAVVAGEKIYQKDFNERVYGLEFKGTIDNPPEISNEIKKWILDDLVIVKIAEKESIELGVEVKDDEVNKVVGERLGDQVDSYSLLQKDLVKKRVKGDLLKEKVSTKSLNWREGKFIVCRFDYPYEFSLDVNSETSKNMMAQDKVYSEKLCTDLYNDVASGKITFDQAMQKIESDKTIGRSRWTEMYDIYNSFNKYDFANKSYYKESVGFWETINSTHKNEVSKPVLVKMKDEDGSRERDAFYMISKVIDEVSTEYNNQEDWFNKMKDKYKVEYKVNY